MFPQNHLGRLWLNKEKEHFNKTEGLYDSINNISGEKESVWNALKKRKANRTKYMIVRRACKHIVYTAKKVVEEKKFGCIKESDVKILKIAKRMKRTYQDGVAKKCFSNDN